jgi:hypothetical protein
MRVLLVQPEDSPAGGPWSRRTWDLVVDLGKSSPTSEESWTAQYRCPVLRADAFRQGITDVKKVRESLSVGVGRLVDEEGIDWWQLLSLLAAPDAVSLMILKSVMAQVTPGSDLWATRRGVQVRMLESLLNRSIPAFGDARLARTAARVMHYAGLLGKFSPAQLKEIILDKYDSDYRLRSRFAKSRSISRNQVVLVPSAYTNVSRMVASYAILVPEMNFLLVATRQSAKRFEKIPNLEVRDLAEYANNSPISVESASLGNRWTQLREELASLPDLRPLVHAGVMDSFSGHIRAGIAARNAWRRILEHEPVCGVFCGDDSNIYTRLPVLLAASRKIPTVDFHHGALDGRYALKNLPCDTYLAKNEMECDYLVRVCELPPERIAIGAPPRHEPGKIQQTKVGEAAVIFFSEPYEAGDMRAEEIYRELVPRLLNLARENDRSLIIKLHPFESRSQRERLVREVLDARDQKAVEVIDGPLTSDVMSRAWFGITVESTTVIDCLQNGVPCFLCGWLALSPYEYGKQYARFGVGEILQDVQQVAQIPSRLQNLRVHSEPTLDLSPTIGPAVLRQLLTSRAPLGVRSSS